MVIKIDETKVKEIVAEIKDGLTKEVVDQLKAELPLRKDIFGSEADEAKAQKLDEQTKAAEFFKAVFHQDRARAKELGQRKGQNETTDADGGFLVPEYVSNEIITVANNYGIVRKLARHIPMSSHILRVPSASGVTVYRISEGAKITSSKATISRTTLTAKKLAALIPVTNELLDDSNPDIVSLLTTLAGEAFAAKEDEWGLAGLDTGEGVFQSTGVTGVTMGAGKDAFSDVTLEDLLNMQGELKSGALSGAKYVMNHTVLNLLRTLKETTTGGYLLGPAYMATQPALWNLPYETTDALPGVGDSAAATKFIALVNFAYMMFGDRKSLTMEISNDATVTDTDGTTVINSFEQDMSVIRFIERIDIQLAAQADAFAWLKTAAS